MALPDASIESSTNEATYDPESGVIVLPVVMVLTEGEPSVETYSMELQQTEESIFEVTQQEKITALPLNATNGIAGDSARLRTLTARSGGSSRWCSGNPDQNLDAAKENFKAKCGEAWDDQKGHVCDYKSDGYHCNGNRSAAASPATSDPSTSIAADTGWCSGTPDRNIAIAKRNFHKSCGQLWNDQLGHVCEWKSDGWHCRGNKSASSAPSAPTVTATRTHPRVVYIEWAPQGNPNAISYYELYRNGKKFASVGSNKRFYEDKQAQGRPTYQVVAVGKNKVRSPSSNIAEPVDLVHPGARNGIPTEDQHRQGNRNVYENGRITADITQDASITHRSEITDEAGNSLGTITEVYDGENVRTELNPTYGEPSHHVSPLERVYLQPGLGAARPDIVSAFPPCRGNNCWQEVGGGGGGGGDKPKPGDSGCSDNDCTPGSEPSVNPSTEVDPGCSDNDCDPGGTGGNVGNPTPTSPDDGDETTTPNPHP